MRRLKEGGAQQEAGWLHSSHYHRGISKLYCTYPEGDMLLSTNMAAGQSGARGISSLPGSTVVGTQDHAGTVLSSDAALVAQEVMLV